MKFHNTEILGMPKKVKFRRLCYIVACASCNLILKARIKHQSDDFGDKWKTKIRVHRGGLMCNVAINLSIWYVQ